MATHIAEMEVKITDNAQEDIIFDNLNSCLAMVFVLQDGRMVGGHVVVAVADDPQPVGNAALVLQTMQRMAADANQPVVLFATLGEDPVNNGIYGQPALLVRMHGVPNQHIDIDCTGGIDLQVGAGPNWPVSIAAVRNPQSQVPKRFNNNTADTASLNVPVNAAAVQPAAVQP